MQFLNAKQVAELMDISLSSAYQIIKQLNKELVEQGYRVKNGKINAFYFRKVYGFSEMEEPKIELQPN